MTDRLRAREELMSAALRRVGRAALEMEEATADFRARQDEYNEAVREWVAAHPAGSVSVAELTDPYTHVPEGADRGA